MNGIGDPGIDGVTLIGGVLLIIAALWALVRTDD